MASYAYLTVTHLDGDGWHHSDTIEIDATDRTWGDLRVEAERRLREYHAVKLISAVLTQWSDQPLPISAHPSGRVPMSHCFQPEEL